ncbi:MAG: ribosome hibernation-promoting factor, HPF/YfiA family [Gammaproteobacteria bacterium]
MNINYTWRNTPKTEALETLANKKLDKVTRHFDKITSVHVIFDVDNKQNHHAKATLHIPGHEIVASATSEDMYKAIDDMINKLLRQIDGHKQKMQDHRE